MKNGLKKSIMIVLTLALLFTLCACGGTSSETQKADEQITGGWTEAKDGTITDELKAYFDSAVEGLTGAKYEPIKLVATQVVAGTNYKILCNVTTVTATPETTQKLVTIYVDLEGNSSIIEVADAK